MHKQEKHCEKLQWDNQKLLDNKKEVIGDK